MIGTSKPASSLLFGKSNECNQPSWCTQQGDDSDEDTCESSEDELEPNIEFHVRRVQHKRQRELEADKQSRGKKKKQKTTLTKEEQALEVEFNIASRGGLKRELMFGGQSKYPVCNDRSLEESQPVHPSNRTVQSVGRSNVSQSVSRRVNSQSVVQTVNSQSVSRQVKSQPVSQTVNSQSVSRPVNNLESVSRPVNLESASRPVNLESASRPVNLESVSQ